MYRISTEDTHRNRIMAIARRYFDSFTLIPTIGFWQGTKEKSIAIEVSGSKRKSVLAFAAEVKRINRQQAILIQRIQDNAMLV